MTVVALRGTSQYLALRPCAALLAPVWAFPTQLMTTHTASGPRAFAPARRTAPDTSERRRPSERAEASTAGLDAGAVPAAAGGGVRCRWPDYGPASAQSTAAPPGCLGASSPPMNDVAPFSPSRLPVSYLVKENAR